MTDPDRPEPRGALPRLGGGWRDLLSRLSVDSEIRQAFVARNFTLDEGVLQERAESYRTRGAADGHRDYIRWSLAHQAYLADLVYRPFHEERLPTVLDAQDPDLCPETFRLLRPGGPFVATYDDLKLIRIEELDEFARLAGAEPAQLRALAEQVVSSRTAGGDAAIELAAILGQRAQNAEVRPTFVAFFDDVAEIFGRTPAEDPPEWADDLRDRLGLAHLDPMERHGDIDVLVFCYPVGAVARFRDRTEKALVAPTVLDGRFSPAFLPAPEGGATGHTVVLSGDASAGCPELLHPTVTFGVEHLYRVGKVRRPVAWELLPGARGLQILECRSRSRRHDYAALTDGDLLE